MKVIYYVIITVILCGCTDQQVMFEEVNVALSWIHEAQFAGLYAADQYGYYEDEGIKVNLHAYEYEDLAQELINGKYDFVILQTDTLLLAKEQGLPVKAIFADYSYIPTTYFSAQESGIIKPEDLVGKTVGVAYSERYPLIAMLQNVGIPIESVNIVEREYSYDKLANGEYDVEAGWVTDGEAVRAAVGEYNTISPYDYGVNWYADLIVTTEDMINNNKSVVQSFMRATVKGWDDAMNDIESAALLTKKYQQSMNNDEHLKLVLKISSPLIQTGDHNIGWMERNVFEKAQELLVKQGIIRSPVKIEDVYTVEFLERIHGE